MASKDKMKKTLEKAKGLQGKPGIAIVIKTGKGKKC